MCSNLTAVTYWGLRKYSGEQELIWDGDIGDMDCEHQWDGEDRWLHRGSTSSPLENKGGRMTQDKTTDNTCSLCGAWKGAYGLEPTPEMYIEHTIEILREIRRVLRKDGVVFWNIGDSYASGKGTCFNPGGGKGSFSGHGDRKDAGAYPLDRGNVGMLKASRLKPKDLCLIPFRLAIAAQEDGWWVRSVIIWSKPNPMPESVKDRPTESHEYILMLTKSGTSQYWTHRDHEGSRTQPKPDYRWVRRVSNIRGLKTKGIQELSDQEQHHGQDIAPQTIIEETDIKPEGWTPKHKMGWNRINLWRGHDYYWDADAVREPPSESTLYRAGWPNEERPNGKRGKGDGRGMVVDGSYVPPSGRNIRSVWEFPTQPYPEAHFAVFPEKLPEICIKAATPEVGCCSKCGAPWQRVMKVSGGTIGESWHDHSADIEKGTSQSKNGVPLATFKSQKMTENPYKREELGWQPTCKCNADKVPSIVLDPLAGAGTTLWVAKKLNRRAVGYEISEEYCRLTIDRLRQQVMM